MPKVVAHGTKPAVLACGYCHLPNGQGRPENASLAGLPEAYIIKQMADFKSGQRKNPIMGPIASQFEKQDMYALAAYFTSKKWPDLGQPFSRLDEL